MRKSSPNIRNEHGVILPYVLFITALICMIMMTTVYSYRHDIELTDRHIQQIKIETLFQMGYEKVKSEIIDKYHPPTVSYQFPNGHVSITIISIENTMYELTFNITTNDYDTIYTFTKTLIKED
ncbi:hypothetical protein [Oceanobacillus polygoni]|uniref:Uncharacterized protein n=1 Tax=Oceanobacillus polygoni TaxID=1235259 RepID=A0A9X0YVQ1_9BACI|nr:hypothetical protein [Oceanobacillus polygoni]MBP2078200.1 hypothetical protein [Oceanobacillus polygoni]